jgi:conjugative relaxase-like TrwC/TraI family protein
MLTMSKPLSAGQARRYHAEEFRNARANYYTAGDRVVGHWHGQLAAQWGLTGEVDDEHFERLAEGQHPHTGESLVRHQTPRTLTNARGESVTTMEHRAGWDATFSAPKTVSLTALVAGDDRVREAHRESVAVALDALEPYVQARLGGNRPAETTGVWVAATFEHDSARPVDGYAAPQLHTHVVVFNLTETEDGSVRPMQPRELYRSQAYATAVYRAELAARLTDLGYEIERGAHGQSEIAGYSKAYVEASSPRRQQIEAYLEESGHTGAAAAQIAAHQTREAKRELSPDLVQAQHQAMAKAFEDQPAQVVARAHQHAQDDAPDVARVTARAAVSYATARQFEREAVVEERDLMRDALARGLGTHRLADVRQEVETRVQEGSLLTRETRAGAPGRAWTTPAMETLERENIERMRAGQGGHAPLASAEVMREVEAASPHLSDRQRQAVRDVLASSDQVMGLDGVAGAGKTTTLRAVQDGATRAGYVVEGFAPTSRAAHQLEEAGIPARTLQHYLASSEDAAVRAPRLYVLDESSLASSTQTHALFERLRAEDRVLLVGDVRQHQAVDAGRPYQQLQEAGLQTAHLDEIVRQRDPALKATVEHLSRGEIAAAVTRLDHEGRVHQIADRDDRYRAIADAYACAPEETLVVSPDNASRRELNAALHQAMQAHGYVALQEHAVRVLVPRQDLAGADRQWSEQYHIGDVLRYSRGSETHGLTRGGYAQVERTQPADNTLTVRRSDGEAVTYDARRVQGVTVYREEERRFAVGDRVQFTAPDRSRRIANRELGTVTAIGSDGQMQLRLDSGRTAVVGGRRHAPHVDYGYAVTSHSSQGQTADRVLVHIDTERGGERLVNRRFAYVAISRARNDAQVFTNDRQALTRALDRDVSQRSALDATSASVQAVGAAKARGRETDVTRSVGLSR